MRNQKQHHLKKTFSQEIDELLILHGSIGNPASHLILER